MQHASTEEFIMGGAVRDLLLGRTPRETDIAFQGTVEGFICRNPKARKAGNDFPICILNGIEYAPLRGETIFEDLALRDFTINAVALDSRGRMYLHPLALADLSYRLIRPAGPTALQDDPARVFRAARFAATFPDFHVHAETCAQMRIVARLGLLDSLTPERVAGELAKALATPAPGQFLRVLAQGNCLEPWFTELQGTVSIPAGPLPYHTESVLEHTATVMDRCAGNPVAVYMALCHDLGKGETPPHLLPHHHGHEQRGERTADRLATRLRLSTHLLRAGTAAARHHMKGGQYASLRHGTRVDMLMHLHTHALIDPFCRFVQADSGKDISVRVAQELACILATQLPENLRNLGPKSGALLRERRCAALAKFFPAGA